MNKSKADIVDMLVKQIAMEYRPGRSINEHKLREEFSELSPYWIQEALLELLEVGVLRMEGFKFFLAEAGHEI